MDKKVLIKYGSMLISCAGLVVGYFKDKQDMADLKEGIKAEVLEDLLKRFPNLNESN